MEAFLLDSLELCVQAFAVGVTLVLGMFLAAIVIGARLPDYLRRSVAQGLVDESAGREAALPTTAKTPEAEAEAGSEAGSSSFAFE